METGSAGAHRHERGQVDPQDAGTWSTSDLLWIVDCDDDLAAAVAVEQVPDGRGNVVERVAPVHGGGERARVDHLPQRDQVPRVLPVDERAQLLADEDRQQPGPDLPVGAAQPTSAVLPTHDDQPSPRGEGAAQLGESTVAADVEDDVVPAAPVGDLLAGVVDNVVGTERTHLVDLAGAAHAGDLGAGGLGQLHREGAHAARRPDDQYTLPGPDATVVADGLQGGQPGDGHGGRLGEGQVRRLAGELADRGAGILGERRLPDAE